MADVEGVVKAGEAGDGKEGLMDRKWEEIQQKAFTKWVNSHLRKKNENIENLVEDFENGSNLLKLINVLFPDTPSPKLNKNTSMRPMKLDNCDIALRVVSDYGIELKGTRPSHLVDHDKMMILGMVWILILEYQIKGISVEDLTAKEGLLLWCKKKTAGYEKVDVQNFTTSWQDGRALAALIHRHRPDLMDYEDYVNADPTENLTRCFQIAEEHLDIMPLLDPEDLTDVARPDERSVMAYISCFFHAFSKLDSVEVAGRRIGKFSEFARSVFDEINDYETRATAFVDFCDNTGATLADRTFDGTYDGARAQIDEFREYKTGDKRTWFNEKGGLETLLAQINARLKANSRPPYVPPEGLATDDLDAQWTELGENEKSRYEAVIENMTEVKEALRVAYAEKANALNEVLTSVGARLQEASEGELEAQLEAVNAILADVQSHVDAEMPAVVAADAACTAANIEVNRHTTVDVADLEFMSDNVTKAINNRAAVLENQIALASMGDEIDPDALAEFQSTFAHFDKDSSGHLTDYEFKAGLAGLGTAVSDDDFPALFEQVSEGTGGITLQQFVQYMVEQTKDTDSPDQVLDSFRTLAGGKDFITEQDLRMGQLPEEEIAFLLSAMPETEGGHDYAAYVAEAFGQ